MSKSNMRFALAMLALGLLASVPTQLAAQQAPNARDPELFHLLEEFGQTLSVVQNKFVKHTDSRRAIEGAIEGMLTSLDPHAEYIPPTTFAAMIKPSNTPASAGIGLKLVTDSGVARIVAPTIGGPAERAGLKSGDAVLAVDGHDVEGTPLATILDQLPGEVGQPVTLRIGRGSGPPFDITIVREHIDYPSVNFLTDGDYGILLISALDAPAIEETRAALSAAETRNPRLRGVVLDLRGCPGGLLSSVVAVTSLFVGKGEVLSERGAIPEDVKQFSGQETDQLKGLPIAVLVNETTASGCEILAAALQDRKRATIIGMPTFGQGTVQTVFPLNNGVDGAIKFTTAFMYRPSGRPIQKLGVIPDVVVAQSEAAADDFAQRRYVFSEATLPGALDAEEIMPRALPAKAESPPNGFSGDYQLQRALEVLKAAPTH